MKKKLIRICMIFLTLTLCGSICLNVLSAVRIPKMKAFLETEEGKTFPTLKYNGHRYIEANYGDKATYFFKERSEYYYAGVNGTWLKSVIFCSKIYFSEDDTECYIFSGNLFFDGTARYIREDFVYPSLAKNNINCLYLANEITSFTDIAQRKKPHAYLTTDSKTISSIIDQVLASHDPFACPDSLLALWNLEQGEEYYYVYVDYDGSPCYQRIANVKNTDGTWAIIPEEEAFESGCPYFDSSEKT